MSMSNMETDQHKFLVNAFDERKRLAETVRDMSWDEGNERLFLRAAIIRAGLAKAMMEKAKTHRLPSLDIRKLVAGDKVTAQTDHPTYGIWDLLVEDPANSRVSLTFGENVSDADISYLLVGEQFVIKSAEDLDVDCGKVTELRVNEEPVTEQQYIS